VEVVKTTLQVHHYWRMSPHGITGTQDQSSRT